MADNFRFEQSTLSSPAKKAFAVTPNDGADLSVVARAIYVGSSGDLVVILADDTSTVTFSNIPVGWHPIRAKRIYSTGTTAASIVAVY